MVHSCCTMTANAPPPVYDQQCAVQQCNTTIRPQSDQPPCANNSRQQHTRCIPPVCHPVCPQSRKHTQTLFVQHSMLGFAAGRCSKYHRMDCSVLQHLQPHLCLSKQDASGTQETRHNPARKPLVGTTLQTYNGARRNAMYYSM
jgi:hypothetical protein